MVQAERYPTDKRCWEAVCRRDPVADGRFVYAVTTTGVYCRPTCRSRRPRRDNVSFYATPAAAEREGYRACKRCRPEQTGNGSRHNEAVVRACRTLEESQRPPKLRELAARAGLSPFHFQRVFKRAVGVSPKQYAMGLRQRRFRRALRGALTVTQAIYESGHSSNSRAYDRAAAQLGMRPDAYRRGGRGETIHFGVVRTDLGRVLIAATRRGVCLIEFGDDRRRPAQRVRDEFPGARCIAGGGRIRQFAAQVARFVARPQAGLDLPLDIRGTAFQQRVWRALLRIPCGSTRTYGEVAVSIGAPRGVRAAAGACARNRVALAVPCHRVVRSDGDPGGYRWGVRRKRALLDREGASAGID